MCTLKWAWLNPSIEPMYVWWTNSHSRKKPNPGTRGLLHYNNFTFSSKKAHTEDIDWTDCISNLQLIFLYLEMISVYALWQNIVTVQQFCIPWKNISRGHKMFLVQDWLPLLQRTSHCTENLFIYHRIEEHYCCIWPLYMLYTPMWLSPLR